jgi:RNA-directed DNA polymerase
MELMDRSDAQGIAGTVLLGPAQWPAINWRKVAGSVHRLQARIAKATREGRRGKAHALQRILTRSLGAACWAVRRVTTNKGKRTPGVDGVVWSTPKAKQEAVCATQRGPYKALPLRRVYIPKPNGSKRPLGIPCMKDRAKQAVHALALDPIAECLADPNSYGFRRGRSTADAIEQCFIVLARRVCAPWVLEGDITACYDRISHEWLGKHVPMDKGILSKWLKSGYVERNALHATDEGTPQGGIISSVLCNLTLDGLESLLKERFKHHKVNLVRYADDFIVTADTEALLRDEVKPVIEEFLADRGLELSEEKTRIVRIEDGFDFLGQHVRKYNGKLLIKPARKSVTRLLAKVREVLKANPSTPTAAVIRQLNPIIRGWANYHRHVCSKETFSYVDWQIWRKVWRWAKRRHPMKSAGWVKDRYFPTQGTRQWVFTGVSEGGLDVHLVAAAATPIQRHIKVQGTANPYDPLHSAYFARRRANKGRGRASKGGL